MKRYSMGELSRADAYLSDPELATLARHAATAHFEEVAAGKMGRGDFKRACLNGEYPELIKPLVDEAASASAAAGKQREDDAEALSNLKLPDAYTAAQVNGQNILSGPYDSDLVKRLGRIGHFDHGEKCWVIDPGKASSLKRVFSNWSKGKAAEAEKLEENLREQERVRAAKERKRAEEEAAEKARRAAAKAGRIKVVAEKYRVGDKINGRKITGFGQSWSEEKTRDVLPNPKELFGESYVQLWEPCKCGEEPVYAPGGIEHMGIQQCLRCWARDRGIMVTTEVVSKNKVCYAYFA